MKITRIAEKINLNQVMDISVDVHKERNMGEEYGTGK